MDFFGSQSSENNLVYNGFPYLSENQLGNMIAWGGVKDVVWKYGYLSPNPLKHKSFKMTDTTGYMFGAFGGACSD